MRPIDLITNLRESSYYITSLYNRGDCYKFYLFLKSIWKDAESYMTNSKDHIVTKIGEAFYDINGFYLEKDIHPITEKEIKLAETWDFKKQNLLLLGECSICGEPIVYTK